MYVYIYIVHILFFVTINSNQQKNGTQNTSVQRVKYYLISINTRNAFLCHTTHSGKSIFPISIHFVLFRPVNYYNGKGTLMFQGKDGKQLEQQLISAFQRIGRQPGAVPTAKKDLKRGRPEEDATPIPKRQKAERMPQGATAESNHIVTVDDDVRNTARIAVPTKPAIARSGAVVIYVDGSCLGNVNVRQTAQPAGWGVYITGAHNFELYGPVITDPKSPFFYGAECGSNNTAELSAMVEALLWLLSSSVATATMCYDSKYAAMIMTMVYRAHKNVELAGNLQKLYVQAKKVMKISIKKVKGHSNNPGNDAADRLANLSG
eukprot:GEMP01034622.1.p1 GENE.GEMP01034622.1~~GEMP01034622.1.p1  ORF type:complete len:320 (+),score=44.48 GEMP01034622.1:546-1505(+)